MNLDQILICKLILRAWVLSWDRKILCKNTDWNSFWLKAPTLSSFSGLYFCLGYLLENPFTCSKTHYFFLISSIHRLSERTVWVSLLCPQLCLGRVDITIVQKFWRLAWSHSFEKHTNLFAFLCGLSSLIFSQYLSSTWICFKNKKDMKSPFLQYGTCNVPVSSRVSPAAVSDLRGLPLLNCVCVSIKPACSFLSYNEWVQSDLWVCYYSGKCELI